MSTRSHRAFQGCDHKGGKLWGGTAHTTLGRASRDWSPATCLSATPYITEPHAKKANHGVHSPGPAAYHSALRSRGGERHVPCSAFHMSGPGDRFYDRFEAHRIQ
jgi:hypothetical protein